jgi:hypothetical protein
MEATMTTALDGNTLTIAAAEQDTRWYGEASALVARFLNQLRCIPAATWLAAAERAPMIDEFDERYPSPKQLLLEEQADYAARRRLHYALRSMPKIVERISSRINNDLAIFSEILPETAVHRMRRIAHVAAFAVAAHAQISHEDLRRLYRPFLDLIPPPRGLILD